LINRDSLEVTLGGLVIVCLITLDVQEENYSKIKVYPNPATSVVTIDFYNEMIEQGEVLINSINGVLLSKKNNKKRAVTLF